MLITDDLDQLLEILPEFIRFPLSNHAKRKYLIEIVMDLGRRPEARFPHGPEYLSSKNVNWYDLDYCIKQLGNFSGDNRSGIEYTLHRISSIKNRQGSIIGLTFRVGRAIFGTISIIRDLLERGDSLLLLGRPGVGKTTAIREIARVLADEMEKRVVIIDTSNEIAGDGDIPHPAIGRARRMQVAHPELQHQVMIEAVENHMPEVIIIDEIGTELEALAARTIAERGVQLVGTAHGNYLHSLIKNPTLSDLIGGIQYVTLGDEEAKRRGSQKSIIERKASPAFNIAIEIHDRNTWIVHEQVDKAVDQILHGSLLICQRRRLNDDSSISIECDISNNNEFNKIYNGNIGENNNITNHLHRNSSFIKSTSLFNKSHLSFIPFSLSKSNLSQNVIRNNIQLYIYSLNIQQIETAIQTLQLPVELTRDIIKADFILAIKSSVKHNTKLRQIAKSKKVTIYTIQSSTLPNIIRALKQMLQANNLVDLNWNLLLKNKNDIEKQILIETRFAIEKIVFVQKQSVELLPRSANLRKIQHNLINLYNLTSRSFGEEPNRRLRIYAI
uniref:Conserved hypothetical plastid protein n=1 Tax=Campylaephora sungminbooi TaxID=1896769 RepID=A0A1B0TI90_9FLOR|nr:hypothetical protein BI106_gp094 [Campylaephora sungminbooi]AKU47433.1 hypothetical protein [Campylaephora sungminbooi]ALN11880.1 conserved hypothetical plastid protein [Campylaephora sungminbooi]